MDERIKQTIERKHHQQHYKKAEEKANQSKIKIF
jgi:hypothetical protein